MKKSMKNNYNLENETKEYKIFCYPELSNKAHPNARAVVRINKKTNECEYVIVKNDLWIIWVAMQTLEHKSFFISDPVPELEGIKIHKWRKEK